MTVKIQSIPSPTRVLISVLLIITSIEVVVMHILPILPFPLDGANEAFVDSALLGLLSTPLLWLVVIRPLERAALHQLASSESQHRAIIASMLDAHIIIDERGQIESFNPAAEEMFGYAAKKVIGRNVSLLMPEPYRMEHDGYLARYLSTKHPHILGKKRVRQLKGQRADGEIFPIELLVNQVCTDDGADIYFSGVIRDITVMKAAEAKLERLAAAVHCSVDAIDILDSKGRIVYVNPAWEELYRQRLDEVVGGWAQAHRRPNRTDENFQAMIRTTQRGEAWSGNLEGTTDDGQHFVDMVSISPIHDDAGELTSYVTTRRDVTERVQLVQQLGQAQKLESIGQLAAGIAHEINTPTQYVSDNTVFLQRAFGSVMEALQSSERLLEAAQNDDIGADIIEQTAAVFKKAKLDFLKNQVPPAFEQSLEGLERVSRIVGAMKEFSHPAQEKTSVDLNRAIQSTITVASNEWKYVADMQTEFDPELPLVPCLPGDFNQVVLNIIVNASHAISDVVGDGANGKGTITISTRQVGDDAEIRIADSGAGMPEDVRAKIFDAFFTTKAVGKGTGQGLSIAYNVVVEKHEGTIDVESEPGKGTTFIIRLPLVGDQTDSPAETEAKTTGEKIADEATA